MRRRRLRALTGLAAAAILLAGCAGKETAPPEDRTILAVCSISVVEDLVKNVGRDLVETSALVTGLENPHTFSPTPAHSKKIAQADLFFQVGLGLESWATGLVEASGNRKLRIIVLSDGIETMTAGLADEREAQRHDGSSRHNGANPHIWMDPSNGVRMTDRIAQALGDADPEHREIYEKNAREYKEKLRDLGRRIKQRAASLERRSVATHAPAFSYLLRFMGLREALRVQLIAAEEPPAKRMANIIQQMKRRGDLRVLLTMPQYSDVIPSQIAREAGAKLVYVTPLLTDEPENSSYLKMIETTATKIIDALESE